MRSSTRASDSTDAAAALQPSRSRSAWWDALARLRRSRGAWVGVVILGLIVLSVLGAGVLSPQDPLAVDANDHFLPPGPKHLFGTDILGRDILSRVLFGGRLSLVTGLISVSFALLLGVPMGVLSGFYGGVTDRLIMRAVDLMLTFPGILLAIALMLAACDKPAIPKIAAPQREALEKAKGVDQVVQQNTEESEENPVQTA